MTKVLFILSAIGTFIIIPYMMSDINQSLENCQELVEQINENN